MLHKLAGALALIALAILCSLALPARPLQASALPASCAGTYLIKEAGGAQDFWTFSADGAFFGTTSTQPLYDFSNQQGSWEKTSATGARGALLAFVFNPDHTLLTTARIDITIQTVGQGCDQIAGSLVVRTYEGAEDPLTPASDTGSPIATDILHRPPREGSPLISNTMKASQS